MRKFSNDPATDLDFLHSGFSQKKLRGACHIVVMTDAPHIFLKKST